MEQVDLAAKIRIVLLEHSWQFRNSTCIGCGVRIRYDRDSGYWSNAINLNNSIACATSTGVHQPLEVDFEVIEHLIKLFEQEPTL